MNSTTFCPISEKKIDENIARLNGGLTLLLLIVFAITANIVVMVFLIFDFALRSSSLSKYSALSFVSRSFFKIFGLKPKMINAGPKIFAARIGLFFNIVILISVLLGLDLLAFIFVGIFGVCAFLESSFGYCVACQVYPIVFKLFYELTPKRG